MGGEGEHKICKGQAFLHPSVEALTGPTLLVIHTPSIIGVSSFCGCLDIIIRCFEVLILIRASEMTHMVPMSLSECALFAYLLSCAAVPDRHSSSGGCEPQQKGLIAQLRRIIPLYWLILRLSSSLPQYHPQSRVCPCRTSWSQSVGHLVFSKFLSDIAGTSRS